MRSRKRGELPTADAEVVEIQRGDILGVILDQLGACQQDEQDERLARRQRRVRLQALGTRLALARAGADR